MDKNYYRIFPFIKNKKKFSKLKIDEESIHFISHKEVASKISSIIISYLPNIKIRAEDIFITDATAGVGGNTISFCHNFGFCNAIEVDDIRCQYLKNNLDLYELKNFKISYGDCSCELSKIKQQDIVFFDPPWGGKNYKNFSKLKLKLSDVPIEQLVYELLTSEKYLSNPKIVVLKLPLNYDITYFFSHFKNNKIYIHKLKKMYILIVLNNDLNFTA